jgi:hypothetical protein
MATILTAHDLSTGDVLSSEVALPNNVRLHWVWGGTQAGSVKLTWQVKDGSGNYVTLKDEYRKPIFINIHAGSDEEGSYNVVAINSSSLKINVEPTDATGTLTLYTYES